VPNHTINCLYFTSVKGSENKADRSPSSNAVVKNEWSYTSTLLEDSIAYNGIILPLRLSGIVFTSLKH